MSMPQPPGVPGAPDPWSPQESGPAAPGPDVLVSPAEAAHDGGGRRRSPLILIAAATVVALVLGATAYAGVRLWYGSGAQPEDATPSTAVAFVRLDLSPGYDQRLKIDNLLKKFPQENGEDAGDKLRREILEALDIDEASYRQHVEPWFAERVGAALWLDGAKRPYTLVVLAVEDESAARAGLAELQSKEGAEKLGFGVRNGYALVARGAQGSQAGADAAAKDVDRESLAASAPFRGDVEWLPARQTLLAWADLAKVAAAMTAITETAFERMREGLDEDATPPTSQMPGGGFLFPFWGMGGFPGMGGPAPLGDTKGRVVVGAQATDNGLEIRFRGFGTGVQTQPATAGVRSTVDSLPANSVIAGAAQVGDLSKALSYPFPGLPEPLPEDMWKGLPPDEIERARKEMQESRKQLDELNKAYSAVAGAKISLSVTAVGDGVPALAATAETASVDKASTLAEALRLVSDAATVTTSGTRVELRTEGYAADSARLADQALYREAVEGAPENAATILYLDIQALLADTTRTGKERGQVQAVKAVGLATATVDGDMVGLLRVVIR
ncbi:MAG TPA: hypothetical protein VFM55_27165 [Micromonosporaceae bacterium]|nr:hypothetical protein [Micromonosporaceae bacterium]